MKHQRLDARVVPYPKYLRFAAAANRSVRHKPMIHGLLEVDVTRVRSALRAHREKTGESLSFTAFLVVCLAKAVDEDKSIQAFRQGRKRLILFEDVDINTRIERDMNGRKYVIPHIICAANRKTFRAVHDEIRAVQVAKMQDVLTRFRVLSFFPTTLYKVFVWVFTAIGKRRPRLWKKVMGTVGITAVGMFGDGAGWGIPAPSTTALMMTVGGIGEKLVVVDGHAAVREYLSLTISVDHDIVDGAPAARFTRRLKELIESGYGLDDLDRLNHHDSTVASKQSKVPQIQMS
jgi:pyruvate/2-oxoglutarate dehydrogenase complex dihydrolipoamide acyltransferase (E2) component